MPVTFEPQLHQQLEGDLRDEPFDAGPWVNLKRLQGNISARMKHAVEAGLVVGWASSVSNAEGTDRNHDAGGLAVVGGTFHEPIYGTDYEKGRAPITGYKTVTTKSVKMTPYHHQGIGSCSKTVMAVASLAAQWAISTGMGKHHPRDLDDLTTKVSLSKLQEQAHGREVAPLLPPDFDVSHINGHGTFSLFSPSPLALTPQRTALRLRHFLQMRSYFLKEVKSAYTPTDPIGAGGHYQNIKEAVGIGPIPTFNSKNGEWQRIGHGTGVYSNAGYDVLRLLTAYTLTRSPEVTGTPLRFEIDTADWRCRDLMLALIHKNFVEQHVFSSCDVDGFLHAVGDLHYYNVDAMSRQDFDYKAYGSNLLTVGGGGWIMSAHGLRKFLVGVQRGKPFGGHRSWWTEVMRKNWFGADCWWLTPGTRSATQLPLPNGAVRLAYLKNGGSKISFSDPANRSAMAGAQTQLFITKDATVTLLVNSIGTDSNIPNLRDVIRHSYKESF